MTERTDGQDQATAAAPAPEPAPVVDTVDVGAEQARIAAELPPGIAVGSRTAAGHEQPREQVVIARGPHDQPEKGVIEGDAMAVAAHARTPEGEAPAPRAPAPLGDAPCVPTVGDVLPSEAERTRSAPARRRGGNGG